MPIPLRLNVVLNNYLWSGQKAPSQWTIGPGRACNKKTPFKISRLLRRSSRERLFAAFASQPFSRQASIQSLHALPAARQGEQRCKLPEISCLIVE